MKCKLVGYEADEYVSGWDSLTCKTQQVRLEDQNSLLLAQKKKKNLIFYGIRHYNEGSFYKLNNFCLLGEW